MSLFQGSYFLPWPILSVLLATLNGVALWRYLQKGVSPASMSFGKRHPWVFFSLHVVFLFLSLLLPVIYHLKSVEIPRVYALTCGTYWNLLSVILLAVRTLDCDDSHTKCTIVVIVITTSAVAAGMMLFFRSQFEKLDMCAVLLCHTIAATQPCRILYDLWESRHEPRRPFRTWAVVIIIIAVVILIDCIVLGVLEDGEHRILAAWFLAFIPSIVTEIFWLYKEFIEVNPRDLPEPSGHELESGGTVNTEAANQGDASSIQTEETLIPAGSCHDPTKN